nr:MAG TPA: hypothetical protein [Crassvirales sp.]
MKCMFLGHLFEKFDCCLLVEARNGFEPLYY